MMQPETNLSDQNRKGTTSCYKSTWLDGCFALSLSHTCLWLSPCESQLISNDGHTDGNMFIPVVQENMHLLKSVREHLLLLVKSV